MTHSESVVFAFSTSEANSAQGFSQSFDLSQRPVSLVIKNNTPFEGSLQFAAQVDSYDVPPYAMAIYRVSGATQQRASFTIVPNSASTIPSQPWTIRALFTQAELPPGIYSTAPTTPGPKQTTSGSPTQVNLVNEPGVYPKTGNGNYVESIAAAGYTTNTSVAVTAVLACNLWPALSSAAGGNAAAIAATSWGDVLTYTFGSGSGNRLVDFAGASLDTALIGQTGAMRILVGGVEVRKYLIPAGTSCSQNVRVGPISTSAGSVQIQLQWYNTSSTTAIPIGGVTGWWQYL